MVDVLGRFCIDRYEISLIDEVTGAWLSPYYPPEPKVAPHIFELWEKKRGEVGLHESA